MSLINFILGFIYVLNASGAITPPMAEYIGRGIAKAEKDGASLILIKLDTPGGLDKSMREIVKKQLNSKVPICVYVHPKGARAASAGAFILLAAHITAMSPGTSVGAAHPITIQGKMDSIKAEKMVNYASSYIKSIAQLRKRDVEIASRMVTHSLSLTAEEAKEKGIADYVVSNEEELISLINGKTIELDTQKITLHLRASEVKEIPMSLREKLLMALTSPNIAYILMMIGIYGLIFELSNPGAIFPGVIGAISLTLAFYSFQTIPVNYAGIILIILGTIFLVLDLNIPSQGLLTLSGLGSIGLGSFLMFKGNAPFLTLSIWSILSVLIFTLIFFMWILTKAVQTFKKKPFSGKEGMIGLKGIVKEDVNEEEGIVLVHGELWQARSKTPITKGEKIKVIGINGLILFVEKEEH